MWQGRGHPLSLKAGRNNLSAQLEILIERAIAHFRFPWSKMCKEGIAQILNCNRTGA